MKIGGNGELRCLTASTSGHSWSLEAFERGLSWRPHVISAQGTTIDAGPHNLGSTDPFSHMGRINLKRSVKAIVTAGERLGIPVVFSGGGSGSDIGLSGILELLDEVAREQGVRFRFAVISGEPSREYLLGKMRAGAKVRRLVPVPQLEEVLSEETLIEAVRVVAQMGPEPIMTALQEDVDGVVTGRSVDEAVHMAAPLKWGVPKGVAAHMAKIVETNAISAGSYPDPMFVVFRGDEFTIKATNPRMRVSVTSVIANTFYERPDPFYQKLPGGTLDLSRASYEQVDHETVRVWGGQWIDEPYTVKLEGISANGYRSLSIVGIREPAMIAQLNSILSDVRNGYIKAVYKDHRLGEDYDLFFKVYGRDGVMGHQEPEPTAGHEVAVAVDAVAKTQSLATAVCKNAVHKLLFADYIGRKTTAGNVASCFSPDCFDLGQVYRFTIHHLLELEDPSEPFLARLMEFPA